MIIHLLVEIVERAVRPAGFAGRFGMVVGFVGHFVVRHLRAVHLAFVHLLVSRFALLGRGGIGSGFFFNLFVFGLAAARLILFRLVLDLFRLLLVAVEILGHLHGGKHVANNLGESLLVLDHILQIIEIGRRVLLDEWAPEVQHLAGAFRWLLASQLFAHQHGDRLADRRLFLPLDAGKIRLGVFLFLHRIEVGGDTGHAQRTDRFDARLLDGIENRTGIRPLRRKRRVDIAIMAGDAQGHGIAKATRHRKFMRRRSLGNFRQANALAGQPRTLIGEGNLHLLATGNRPHAAGYRPPHRFGIDRTGGLAFGIVSATCHRLRFLCVMLPERCWRRFPSARRRRRAGTVRPPGSAPVHRTC
ncbi:hypothetical protein D3C80_614620 [compost metagenome]